MFKGINVGASVIEKGSEEKVKSINSLAEKYNCNIILPVDCNTSTNIKGDDNYKLLNDLSPEDIILDIGKNTINIINKIIDNSNTVFWNGPAGYYENKKFSIGSIAIAKKIAGNTKSNSLVSIVGGGDTIAAIKNTGLDNSFTHLSTAGGAFQNLLKKKSSLV